MASSKFILPRGLVRSVAVEAAQQLGASSKIAQELAELAPLESDSPFITSAELIQRIQHHTRMQQRGQQQED